MRVTRQGGGGGNKEGRGEGMWSDNDREMLRVIQNEIPQ